MYQILMFHADIHQWIANFEARLILLLFLDIVLRLGSEILFD